jgi:thioredoxin-like negative regulator of GroEL
MSKNNIIKVIGSDNCEDCFALFNLIEDCIKQKGLDVEIEKIQSISDEAIDLAMEFEINTIPFAVFRDKKLVFSKKTTDKDLDIFLK